MERDKRLDYKKGTAIRILHEWKNVVAEADRGSNVAITLLMDLELAFVNAKLTNKQYKALELTYYYGYSKRDAALIFGISEQGFAGVLTRAVDKIVDVYNKWEELT